MKCSNHPRTEAVFTCAECGKPICAECAVDVAGSAYCRESLERIVRRARGAGQGKGRWARLVAALLSIVPGAGHMYLGLIGKGFALMGLLFLSVFLVILYSDSTGMYWMSAYLIPTLCVLFLSYAVFDAMEIAEARRSGREPSGSPDAMMKALWERVLLNRRTAGYVVLIAGVVGVLNIFSAPLGQLMRRYLSFEFPVAGLILPVVLVVAGAFLLRKARQR
jgi:TM2 domain-containing membrane protein YozV